MDTKTPLIPLKYQEKRQHKKQETIVEHLFLPPLAGAQPSNAAERQRTNIDNNKKNSDKNWTNSGTPYVANNSDQQLNRPYRVLHIGATPLMHACQQGERSRVLRLLKEQGDTVNYRDRTLRNTLHYCMDASTGGAVASAAPQLVNAPDAEGHTPLHLAVIAGDTQLVAVLLANGANVNAKDLEGHSVLHWATVCGEAECVRLVLAAGARPSTPDLRGGSPLHYAAQCCGAAVTAELSVPKKVGLKVLHTLLEFGADVNAKDEDGRQPILWAASAGSVEAVLALVRAGGSAAACATDKDGLTALHCAASRGHARCVEALVNLCGSQPDHVDDNGCSALHYAATLGHADATALLLRLGADPNRQDRKGRTPALCAAAKGQLETLKILAQHGGSLHARTVRGTGVAHEAVLSGRIELIEWLAKKKPSTLDVATHDGRTPLHVAALHGYLDICKVLLDHGARINAIFKTIKSGSMTPLDAALYRGHRDCAKLIQMHGGITAHHVWMNRTTPNRRVFAAKVKIERSNSTSPSDSESRHRRHRKANVYIEERWIEKRTRKHNSTPKKKHEKRRGSRSFSEEEVRLSKDSCHQRPRRAKSESSRYQVTDVESTTTCRRKYSKHEYSESSSETDNGSSDEEENAVIEREIHRVRRDNSLISGDPSLSDDSLEVVVVKRSVEKKSEKIKYSDGKLTKKPREATCKEMRVKSRSSRIKCQSEDKLKSVSNGDTRRRKRRRSRRRKNENSCSGEDEEEEEKVEEEEEEEGNNSKVSMKQTKGESEEKMKKDMTDSTSQETVERVTVTAIVHKDQPPDTPIIGVESKIENNEQQETSKAKMYYILEKADEMQNSLMTKAADMKRDVEDIRRQVNQEASHPSLNDDNQYNEDDNSTPKGREETEQVDVFVSNPPAIPHIQQEFSPLQSQPEDNNATSSGKLSPVEQKQYKENDENEEKKEQTNNKNDDSVSIKSAIEHGSSPSSTKTCNSEETIEPNYVINKDERIEKIKKVTANSDSEKNQMNDPYVEKISSEKMVLKDQVEPDKKYDSPFISSKDMKKMTNSRPSTAKSKSDSVIESPEWDEEDEQVAKEIQNVVENNTELETEPEYDDELAVLRVLPSTSEEETPRKPINLLRNSKLDALTRVDNKKIRVSKERRDSGGRDSGIEPSPRISKIPKRTLKCHPNTERQQTLNMETIQRDVQINLRRYHLERKIFFQLMELKRLQIRHGRVNEHILIKRQVESFNKSGMSGPTLGVARYDQPLTFRHFEGYLYEQLRRLQKRPATPDWCTEAKQCTQKTHRCHHATSAYTSLPIYTYLDGGGRDREESTLLPRIENRGKGQMTVEVTKGEEKQVIALPAEKLDRTKRYFITFTVRGEAQNSEVLNAPRNAHRNTKSV
ncbi:ankycorbin isoform X2 [Diachasma alloeum]|uniref:ankycorbin isoform X2 n=1 Tax=Diachasma alloeum TaxID=454923 RepID=UPI0007381FC5|nr:ankycorbin isoform X2 [Diachasma alloeum]